MIKYEWDDGLIWIIRCIEIIYFPLSFCLECFFYVFGYADQQETKTNIFWFSLHSLKWGWKFWPHLLKVKKFKSSQSKLWVFRERSWTGKLALGSLKLDQMLLWWARAQKLCKIWPFSISCLFNKILGSSSLQLQLPGANLPVQDLSLNTHNFDWDDLYFWHSEGGAIFFKSKPW